MTGLPSPNAQDDPQRLKQLERDLRVQQAQATSTVFRLAMDADPMEEAERARLSLVLGVPAHSLPADLTVPKREAKVREADEFLRGLNNERVRRQFEDLPFVRLLHDDLGNLKDYVGTFDWISRNYESGATINEAGLLKAKLALAHANNTDLSPGEKDRLAEIDYIQRAAELETGIFDEATKLLGQMIRPSLQAVAFGGASAAAGSAFGPGGAAAGFTYGTMSAFAAQAAVTEFGHQYESTYRSLIDAGTDPKEAHSVALQTAAAYGVGSAALETLGFGPLLKPFTGAGAAVGRRLLAKGGLAAPTAGRAAGEFVKDTLRGGLSETFTEGGQELLGAIAENVAGAMTDTDIGPTVGEALTRAGEVMLKTAKGMAVIAPIGPALHYAADLEQVKKAKTTQEFFTQLAEKSKKVEVLKRSPETLSQLVEARTIGTEMETVYIEGPKLAAGLQQAKITREQFAQTLPEVAKQLDAAERTGEDVAIPMGEFAAKIAATDLYPAIKQSVRFKNGWSVEQAEVWEVEQGANREAAMKKVATEAAKVSDWADQATAVEQRFLGELAKDTRITPARARDYAAAHRQWVEVHAAAEGKTPKQFDEEHKLVLSVTAGGAQKLQQFVGENVAGWEVVKRKNEMVAAGASPREILAETGLQQGTDGSWMFELDDSKSKWRQELMPSESDLQKAASVGRPVTLADLKPGQWSTLDSVLDHPELFEKVPSLKKVTVRLFTPEQSQVGERGYYHPRKKEVALRSDLSLADGFSILHHEIQHAIQDEANFAKGGSPDAFSPQELSAIERTDAEKLVKKSEGTQLRADVDEFLRLDAEEIALVKQLQSMPGPWKERGPLLRAKIKAQMPLLRNAYEKLGSRGLTLLQAIRSLEPGSNVRAPRVSSFDAYRRLAGETQARNTADHRLHLTAEERRRLLAGETADVPPDEQIVRPGEMRLSQADAEAAAPSGGAVPASLPPWATEKSGVRLTPAQVKASPSAQPKASMAEANYRKIDAVFAKVPNPLASVNAWRKFMALLTGTTKVLAAPLEALRYAAEPQRIADYLKQLRPDQLASRREGFALGAKVQAAYRDGTATETTTARLLAWGMLSRSAGAFPHEAAYMDLVNNGLDKWIELAKTREWTDADVEAYSKWSAEFMATRRGGVSPAAQVTSNANDIGRHLLPKLSKRGPDGRSGLQKLHDLIAGAASTDAIRRAFFSLGDGLGIQNKVLSFVLLVSGRTDTLVLDRVQITHLWGPDYQAAAKAAGVPAKNDGSANIYDPPPGAHGKGGLAPLGEGHLGLAIYEALARGLRDAVQEGYRLAGLEGPGDGTLGAFHWDSWLAESSQAIGHPTIEAAVGPVRPDLSVRQGKFDTYGYGTRYRADGLYEVPLLLDSSRQLMTAVEYKQFIEAISSPSGGVRPKEFSVSSQIDRPWVDHPEVSKARYDEVARSFGRPALEVGGATSTDGAGSRPAGEPASGEAAATGARPVRSGVTSVPDIRGVPVVGQVGTGFEIDNGPAGRKLFADLMREAVATNKWSASVTLKSADDLVGAQLFLTQDGKAGVAVSSQRELTGGWAAGDAPRGAGLGLFTSVVQAAPPNTLWAESFATKLADFYVGLGFRPVSRMPFNPEFAPSGWDYDLYRPWQDGKPDVVWYAIDGQPRQWSPEMHEALPVFTDYDAGLLVARKSVEPTQRLSQASESLAGYDVPQEDAISWLQEQDPEMRSHFEGGLRQIAAGQAQRAEDFLDIAERYNLPELAHLTEQALAEAGDANMRAAAQTLREERLRTGQFQQLNTQVWRIYQKANQNLRQEEVDPTRQPRGEFEPSTNTIFLHEKADATTVLHEMSHFWMTTLFKIASQPSASARVKQDADTLLKWFGVKDLATWNGMTLAEQKPHHEAFAYNAEAHWFGESKSPTADPEMRRLFRTFGRWVRAVYRHARDVLNATYRREFGKDLPSLTPDVRAVFDRMLASEDAIAAARSERSLEPMATTKPEDMSDEDWKFYLDSQHDSVDEATEELQRESLRAMKWLGTNESRIVKQLQKSTRAVRKKVEAEVRAQLESQPVYRARASLRSGEVALDDGSTVPLKLRTFDFRSHPMGDATREPAMRGMLSETGQPADVLAPMFGFEDSYQLIRDLISAPDLDAEVQRLTDERMLKEHSDLLDPAALRLKVEKALHNDARMRMAAAELKWLAKITTPVRLMIRAAREFARDAIGKQRIGDVKPYDHALAEVRFRREAERMLAKGDHANAALAKRRELLEAQKERIAIEVRDEIEATRELVKKLFRSDKKLANSRDVDYVAVARYLASAFHLIDTGETLPASYLEKVRAYNPQLIARVEPILEQARRWAEGAAREGRPITSWRDLTVDEFRDLTESIDALWNQSLREQQYQTEQRLMTLEEVKTELQAQDAKSPPAPPQPLGDKTTFEKLGGAWHRLKQLVYRPEHWALRKDGGEEPGAFTRYFWRPVRAAVDRYVTSRNTYTKRITKMVQALRPKLKQGLIEFRDTNGQLLHTFGRGNGGFGHAELIAALLHTGNASNLERLLTGRRWGALDKTTEVLDVSHWNAFMQQMIAQGYVTKDVMDFVQSVWDLNEEVKPLAQRAHRALFGFYFNEIEATEIKLPFGTYRGGYAPAKLDPSAPSYARNQSLADREKDFRQQFASTGRGFMKERAEHFGEPLLLDLDLVPSHIDDVLRFSHLQPVVRDVERLAKHSDVAAMLEARQPGVWQNMLLPWLQRVAAQTVTKPGMNSDVDRFWSFVRSSAGISTMFANIGNALQQVTGVLVAALKVKPRYLFRGFGRLLRERTALYEDIAEKSEFMRNRQGHQLFDDLDTIEALTRNRSKLAKARAWSKKHAYFLQSRMQNMVDSVVWSAAYEQSLAASKATTTDADAEAAAVTAADAAVRQTQSSFEPTDVAGYEHGTPFYRLLTMFAGYFNTLANLQADRWVALSKKAGWAKAGPALYLYLLGFALPTLMADAITRTVRGQWDDEDDDGDVDVLTLDYLFLGQLRAALAQVPVAGPAVLAPALNAFDNQPWNDRMTTSPAITTLERSIGGGADAIKTLLGWKQDRSGAVVGPNGETVRDILSALGLGLGVPAGAVGNRAGYATDVAGGRISPAGTWDMVRGLISGAAGKQATVER